MFNNKSILITGGTGSFGQKFVIELFKKFKPKKVIIYSRDEMKQFQMQQKFPKEKYPVLRYILGDVRDLDRLTLAFKEVNFVIHAAALKQVPAAEYNPSEFIKTNILGAENVIKASLINKVSKIIALSTDKAANPINLYGATKLVSDKLFIAANNYAGKENIRFSVVRYGNVVGSRASVVPLFLKLNKENSDFFPITDEKMTRFWISLDEGTNFVLKTFYRMVGGEIFIPKIPSMNVNDILKSIAPNNPIKIIGKRPGEKVHETLLSEDESENSYESNDRFVTFPSFIDFKKIYRKKYMNFKKVVKEFSYTSLNNSDWIKKNQIKAIIEKII